MDNLQHCYLMGYDAALWGRDKKNQVTIMTTEEIDWYMAGYEKGQIVRDNERLVKEDEQQRQ